MPISAPVSTSSSTATRASARVAVLAALLVVCAMPVAAAVVPGAEGTSSPMRMPWWGVAAAFALAGHVRVELPSAGEDHHSMTFGHYPMVIGLALLHPVGYLAAHLVGGAVGLRLRGQPWFKLAFNAALLAVEAVASVTLHTLLVGTAPADGVRNALATLTTVALVDLLGAVLVASAMSLHRGALDLHDLTHSAASGVLAALANASVALVGVVLIVRAPAALALLGVVVVVLLAAYRAHTQGLAALQRETAQREHAATHDALTGLPNRLGIETTLAAALVEDQAVGLLLVDLVGFSRVNEGFGREVGDAVLRTAAARLGTEGWQVARLGADEFAVVVLGAGAAPPDLDASARASQRALAVPYEVEGVRVSLGARAGTALAPAASPDSFSAGVLLGRAEAALHEATRGTRSAVAWSADSAARSADRLAMATDLADALEVGDLTVVFQPSVELATMRPHGAEALVRWTHPVRGAVPPDVFVPLAERTDLVRPLTRLVLGRALRQLAAWQAGGGVLRRVSVNLSAVELTDPALVEEVERLLGDTGVHASALTLEITETAVVADPVGAARVLADLRDLGVGLALDDFGTGHSPLTYLQGLPVTEVKVDRSFVRQLAEREQDRAIVRALIGLAHDLGKIVVAEGVEDVAALELLRAWGCDLAQGYLFARPLAAADLPGWVAAQQVQPMRTSPLLVG